MQVTVYDQSGKEAGKMKLNAEIFGIQPNQELVHQALVRQHANARLANAHTKTRGEVRGGGRKPFRQKGTGNARRGSNRSPILVGGGTIFGPRSNRNYGKMMPKKQRRKALFSVLSSKAATNAVLVLEKYEDADAKTKKFAEMMSKLPVNRNALVVSDRETKNLLQRVSGNVPNVKTIMAQYLNIHDLTKYQTIVFLKGALTEMDSIFLTSNK